MKLLFRLSLAVIAIVGISSPGPLADVSVSAQAAQASPPAGTAAPVAPTATFQDKFITTSEGRKIHYVDWGNAGKRPFIMLHGINRTGHSFDKVAPLLQNDYHVIAMTLRGHGDSDWSPKHEYLAEHHASDLHSLIEQLNLRDVVLNGNSMGGRVVQVYAGQHPERVWKLIVDDVGPERPESVTKTLTSRMGQETDRLGLRGGAAEIHPGEPDPYARAGRRSFSIASVTKARSSRTAASSGSTTRTSPRGWGRSSCGST